MKVYNVRIGLQYGNVGAVVKSFTNKDEAVTFYNQYHPNIAKELNEKDTLNIYHKRIILSTGV